MSAVLGIDPTLIRVVSIKKGSVIIEFDIQSQVEDETQEGVEEAEVELTVISEKLKEAVTEGEMKVFMDSQALDSNIEITLATPDNGADEELIINLDDGTVTYSYEEEDWWTYEGEEGGEKGGNSQNEVVFGRVQRSSSSNLAGPIIGAVAGGALFVAVTFVVIKKRR
mmetsp:Transcript_28483/g.25345  ORF Transcript_28483/g.25345 Transcript_28483/m.25345 type:complete len:168 (+) Transcript_28483:816-1319(+)